MQYLGSWRNAQVCSVIARFPCLNLGDGDVSWVKPQEKTLKVTVIVATFSENNTFGIGMVARNNDGGLVSARDNMGCRGNIVFARIADQKKRKESLRKRKAGLLKNNPNEDNSPDNRTGDLKFSGAKCRMTPKFPNEETH
ncbi:hypothetical protein AgCh_030347 [Apium graveolens]